MPEHMPVELDRNQMAARVARDIGSALGLNLDLIEAIALGHDVGHTPFGHAGERCLHDVFHAHTGRWFRHNVQSVEVLDRIYELQKAGKPVEYFTDGRCVYDEWEEE
jgi:dGTP triphosphohydrolase